MIPYKIFQTHRFRWNELPPYVFAPINSWVENNPGFEHIYFDQEMKDDFMSSFNNVDLKKAYFHPETMRTAQADIFRVCALYEMGGFYADSDLMSVGCIEDHVDMGSIFSLEASFTPFLIEIKNEKKTYEDKVKLIENLLFSPYPEHLPSPFLQNHFFGCQPKSKFLEFVVEKIAGSCFPMTSGTHRMGRREIGAGETGPAVWCTAFLDFFKAVDNSMWAKFSINSSTHAGLFIDMRGSITWNDGPFTDGKLLSIKNIFDDVKVNSAPRGDNSNKNTGTIKFYLDDGHGCAAYE